MATMERPESLQVVENGRVAVMGATCPSCGSTNTHRVQVKNGDVVVRTYFECSACGNVW